MALISKGFDNQGDLLIKTRLAADTVGATKMDRPEWIAVDTHAKGSAVLHAHQQFRFRGKEGKAPVDAANPRANNQFGHIMHWREERADPASAKFTWNILALAGRSLTVTILKRKAPCRGQNSAALMGSPSITAACCGSRLHVSSSTINKKAYEGMGNNQMIATLPGTNEYRRFLTGPRGCGITGIAFTPDNRTLFINIQHPGEGGDDITDPSNPRAISNWPDSRSDGRPRSSTVVITKSNGGIIGT
ncbi:PhoX family protein [Klebsiella pneumoniae]